MGNNTIQPRVFGVKHLLRPLVQVNALCLASCINSDFGPQLMFNTSSLWLNLILYNPIQGKQNLGAQLKTSDDLLCEKAWIIFNLKNHGKL